MTARIELYSEASLSSSEMQRILERSGFPVSLWPLSQASEKHDARAGLLLVDAGDHAEAALRACRELRAQHQEDYAPILFVTRDASPAARLASLECGADTYLLRPFDPAELLAQARALVRVKDRHDALISRTQEVHRINKRLAAAYQQLDMELQIARRIQESFLPHSLPNVPEARFAVKYRPCGRVGGDFYDIFRLDEHHLGFYVADAMGHGVPASLLTIFVKTTVCPKKITGQTYRLAPPGEVLAHLNRELIAQKLSDNPFITLVYCLYDVRQRRLSFARAGHPYPLYIPRTGPARFWQVEGSLLGIFEAEYRMQTHTLEPGDKVLFYTDGMDSAGFESLPTGTASLAAAAQHFRSLPIDALVERLSEDLFAQTEQADDLSIVGLEIMA